MNTAGHAVLFYEESPTPAIARKLFHLKSSMPVPDNIFILFLCLFT